MNNVVRYSLAATVLALGMVVSSLFLSKFFVRVKHEKAITVKGFADARVASDIGKLTVRVKVAEPQREEAYRALTQEMEEVKARIKTDAPDDLLVETPNPDFSANYKLDEDGDRTNEILSYTGSQRVTVTSGDVQWIKATSQSLNALIGEGYDLQIYSPTFLVSDLTQTKQDLLERATADGFRRAELMARNSGAAVGALRAARQGVFQITVPNSTETSSYGMYDTSTIEKSIKAVVTLEYSVE